MIDSAASGFYFGIVNVRLELLMLLWYSHPWTVARMEANREIHKRK